MSFTVNPVTDAATIQLCRYITCDDASMVDGILDYYFGDNLDRVSCLKIHEIYVDCNKTIADKFSIFNINIKSDELDKACIMLSEKLIEINHPQYTLICPLLSEAVNEIQNMSHEKKPWHISQSVLWIEQNNDLCKKIKKITRELANDV